MRSVAATGTRYLRPAHAQRVGAVLAAVTADRYVTGAAIGLDAFAGKVWALHHPQAAHVVLLPSDRGRVDTWWVRPPFAASGVELIEVRGDYADRNCALVRAADLLIAFPQHAEYHPASRRSGTWQTIRMARRRGIPVELHILLS